MELDSEDILNEVDELLSKLDKLPDDVRLQALKKLSQKVSAPRLRGGRGGRGRGRGAWRRPASPLCTDTKVQTVNIKKEPVEEFTETDTDHSGTQTEINEAKLRRIEDEAQEKFLGIEQQAGEEAAVVKEVKAKTGKKKKGKTSPDNIIVSGRRHTKKVNYRQLAEYGHGNENQEEEETTQADIKPQAVLPQVKRGRGRPRKYLPVVPTTTTAMQCSSGTQMGDKCTTNANDDKENPGMSEEQGNELDLLESCLKESGIKAGDADRGGKKTNEQQEKVGENEAKASVHVTEEEEEEDDPKTEVQNVYVCDTVEAVDKVLKKKSIKSQYKCDECGKMYSTMSILKTHQIRHRDKADLPFKCNECDFSAASKIELFRHAYKHTDIQLYICEICGNTFSRDTSLREHIEYVHAKTRILKCAQCNFVTYRRSCMRNHVLTHEGTRPVIACPVCGVTFRSKRNLRAHLFSHAGAKPFACEECGKKFIMRNRLAAHKLQVHGPRTHKCSHCIKHFPTIHHLRRHIRIHTGEKPYKCCFCAFSCNTQGNLIKHIRQVHDKINFTYKDFLKESGKKSRRTSGG
ncbi:zinc finger protein 510-like [Homarus americanus]|uniref:zinc finger protein 510-like n=1 Tax=Homarus americanus TaxID=6706 RepID=UPI001C484BF4|nr:zinc finger protein 510-like [Homarus americanus]